MAFSWMDSNTDRDVVLPESGVKKTRLPLFPLTNTLKSLCALNAFHQLSAELRAYDGE